MLAVTALLLAGCGGGDGTGATADPTGPEGSWRATLLPRGTGLSPPLAKTEVTAEFAADGELVGSAGCNSYGGSYESAGSSISIGPLRATRKACADQAAMEQEQAFLTALPRATEFRLEAGTLVLLSAKGAPVAKFESAAAL